MLQHCRIHWIEYEEFCPRCRALEGVLNKPLGYRVADTVPPVKPEWAWQPRIPLRGLTMIFGEAGIGKTTMVTDLIARWTRGQNMPETVGGPFVPINVAVYGFEDDLSSVVVPRLMAAGADLEKVFFLEMDKKRPILPDQVGDMRETCKELNCGVLVLDNIENGMGQVTDTNNSKSIRAALNPLAEMPFPVVAIHHPKKGSVFVDPTEAMGGSQAYTNVARSTMMVIPTDETGQEIAFCAVKSNYVNINRVRTLYFTFQEKEIEPLGKIAYIHWLGGDSKGARYWSKVARERLKKESTQALRPDAHGADAGVVSVRTEYTLKEKREKENAKSLDQGLNHFLESTEIIKNQADSVCQVPSRDESEIFDNAEVIDFSKKPNIIRHYSEPVEISCGNPMEISSSLGNNGDEKTKASIYAINRWVEEERAKHRVAED